MASPYILRTSQEMEPPETLACDLRPYQKQALYWMSELEKGSNGEETEKTLHPCWAAYRVCDGYVLHHLLLTN